MNSSEHRSFIRQLPCDSSWDVIVVGGGPAGCAAATAAAREGCKTLLVEATGTLGGMGTSGLVPAWTPFSDQEKIVYRGIAEKVFVESKKDRPHIPPEALDWVAIDAERLKRIYDDLVTSSGAEVLFHTFLSAVEIHDGVVENLAITNKSGLKLLSAPLYIDCTGDADLAAWAGAGFQKGDEQGNGLMPSTLCFILTNVDEEAFLHGPKLHADSPDCPIYAVMASGRYPLINSAHIVPSLVGPRTVGFNAGHLFGVDNTDPHSTTAALLRGRKLAAAYRDALAEFHPQAFKDSYLVTTGSLLGIRESRRIMGDYTLTLDDYMSRRTFADEISRNSYFLDVHWKTADAIRAAVDHDTWLSTNYRYGRGESHGIPYRCLTPRGLKNVLVAGRSVSTEQLVQGSVRVMPSCLAMGEAAGVAGAMAVRAAKVDVHTIDVEGVRQRLKALGAYIL